MNDIPRFNKDRGNLAIYCFSKVDIRDGILLWSHYAKKHTGVAIEFDFLFRSDVHMYEVQYSKDNFRTGVIPSEELLQYLTKMETCSITQDKWFKRFTSTKHSDWEYEKEWRMLTLSNDHNFLNYMPIDNNKHNYISAVYFGVNIKPDDKDNLIKIIREKFPSIKLFQTTKHDKLIKLDVDAI
jgi:hypothetical protein